MQCIDVTEKLKSGGFSYAENILLNMSAGKLPEELKLNELEAISQEYGDNWFEDMGYTEPEYKKPKF